MDAAVDYLRVAQVLPQHLRLLVHAVDFHKLRKDQGVQCQQVQEHDASQLETQLLPRVVALEAAQDVEHDGKDVRDEGDADGDLVLSQPRATINLRGPFHDDDDSISTGTEQGQYDDVDNYPDADDFPTEEGEREKLIERSLMRI